MRRFLRSLYLQVLVAIVLGALLGHLRPALGQSMRPLGDGFLRLIKMGIAPIVFCTVSVGIATMGDLKKVGRIGLRAVLYFEVVSTVALLLGLGVVHAVGPGRGMNADVSSMDVGLLAAYSHKKEGGLLAEVIPDSIVGAFARGEILPVLLFAVLFGIALSRLGPRAKPLADKLDLAGQTLFEIVSLVMRLAPVGAFGAMAFTVGKYGIGTLLGLGKLMAAFYLTSLLFVIVVLGGILRLVSVPMGRFVRYFADELWIVLGTSSSESVLPRMMEKLERLGCSRGVVGMVIPTGYSFNLDGTSIYLTMAAVFVAQATNTPLSFGDEVSLLVVLLLTSKGAAAVTGGGFVTLSATLSSTGTVPVAGLTLLLGIDRFMSEARALTNLLGNAVATLVIARWEDELDRDRLHEALARGPDPIAPPE